MDDEKIIAVIDDARINIAKAEYILKPKGYEIVGYESGDRFLLDIKAENVFPDLILLDIEMPGKSGIETLKELRDDPVWGLIPVIFVTGHVSTDLIASAAKLKVEGYIKKPFVAEELLKRVELILGED